MCAKLDGRWPSVASAAASRDSASRAPLNEVYEANSDSSAISHTAG